MRRKRKQSVSDEHWVYAIEAAEDGDLHELVRALLVANSRPDWVRAQLAPLFDDRRALPDDNKVLAAADAYYAEKARWRATHPTTRWSAKQRLDAEERIAAKYNISEVHTLHNFVGRQGSHWKRLGKAWRRRQRVAADPPPR